MSSNLQRWQGCKSKKLYFRRGGRGGVQGEVPWGFIAQELRP